MSSQAVEYARAHVEALAQWADTVMDRETYDRQYLLEDLLLQLDVLAFDLSTLDDSTAGLRPTVLHVGGKNFGPGGERR